MKISGGGVSDPSYFYSDFTAGQNENGTSGLSLCDRSTCTETFVKGKDWLDFSLHSLYVEILYIFFI